LSYLSVQAESSVPVLHLIQSLNVMLDTTTAKRFVP